MFLGVFISRGVLMHPSFDSFGNQPDRQGTKRSANRSQQAIRKFDANRRPPDQPHAVPVIAET
jgi:hypothetical protein